MDLKLPTPSDVLRRYEQCESQAAIAQSLVAPLIHNTLGYDIFDPVTVTPDSSGAVGNASLKHPDARVEFAVRRHAIPRLLIAVYHDEENRTTATERLQKCLDQSPARIGAVTDGRCWDWHTRLDDQTVVRYHRTDITRITEPDRALFRAMSNDNWDTDWVLKDGIRKRYEDAIASRMVGELEEPGPEFLHLLAGMVHIGRKNATVLNAVRNAAKAGLRRGRTRDNRPEPRGQPRHRGVGNGQKRNAANRVRGARLAAASSGRLTDRRPATHVGLPGNEAGGSHRVQQQSENDTLTGRPGRALTAKPEPILDPRRMVHKRRPPSGAKGQTCEHAGRANGTEPAGNADARRRRATSTRPRRRCEQEPTAGRTSSRRNT